MKRSVDFHMEKTKLFEVQAVTHRANLISFKWVDLGGMYKVYRDGNLLYEGTVAEFNDGNFNHAKMYEYSIERVANDEVVDVIALQTTAFAEERNMKNPLQFLVMTTIVAKTQIALSWEEIGDVDEYEIYRNGVLMKTVQGNSYIDRDFSLEESYIYRIFSTRPISKSNQVLSGGKSVISGIIGLLKRKKTSETPVTEQFVLSKLIVKPKRLLTSVMTRSRQENVDNWMFRYTTFLQEEIIENPNKLSLNRYFKGDGRGFDSEGESFRTRVTVDLDYNGSKPNLTTEIEIGETVAYNSSKEVRGTGTASKEGIVLTATDHEGKVLGFYLTHAVGNPLEAAPPINYEVQVVFPKNGLFDVTGYHDQAPHHEAYLIQGEKGKWLPIHQTTSEGLLWMSGVTGCQYWRFSSFD